MRRVVSTDKAPKPAGPYSQAISSERFVFVSGQVGIDPATGKLVEGGAKSEAARCMENVKAVLSASGLDVRDIVKTTIFVTDMSSFKEVNEAYGFFFYSEPPARSTIGVAALPLGAKVEIECIALRPKPSL
ncbi:MAG TPA: RidA family protein [Methanomassiliicoccales archaeon]|nr:RidA family protein [Methanomassiliicoccales archaeon]